MDFATPTDVWLVFATMAVAIAAIDLLVIGRAARLAPAPVPAR